MTTKKIPPILPSWTLPPHTGLTLTDLLKDIGYEGSVTVNEDGTETVQLKGDWGKRGKTSFSHAQKMYVDGWVAGATQFVEWYTEQLSCDLNDPGLSEEIKASPLIKGLSEDHK